ncbi:class I SAM-dependent methyltransferase [Chitinophaga sp.]|uniref:class I SAM-dependent methyltransferase n=1 Tax=Chitinophaga sp. TaxID=1869181 RepID=UPI0031CFA22F
MDKSNGYDAITGLYLQQRGGIGSAVISSWAASFPPGAAVIDLGCGTGFPVTKILAAAGLQVYAVDASASMVALVQQHIPGVIVACEAMEESLFFNRTFDGIISIGVMFLLSAEQQRLCIQKMAAALKPSGKLLFTAPLEETTWKDVLTQRPSLSLGAATYRSLLAAAGLSIGEELEDEGGNHYYTANK